MAESQKTREAFIVPHLRWWICGLLFASTAINYIERQTVSVLGPYLKIEFQWSNAEFALILIAFRLAYTLGQTPSGWLLDRLGTRIVLLISVGFYSLAAAFTGLAVGLRSFAGMRFLVGAGESTNWPGATKAVSEWFPKSERGWAIAIFDSGSAVGGAIVPVLVLWLYHLFGAWRPVFFLTGSLGFIWVVAWRIHYRSPEVHPYLGKAEREMLEREKALEAASETHAVAEGQEGKTTPWLKLFALPHTWGIILSRTLTDPVWFLIMDWFAVYFVSKGFKLENILLGFSGPYIAGYVGNYFSGGLSSELIRRGWHVLRARKLVILLGTMGMIFLIPAVYISSFGWVVLCFSIAAFGYSTYATMLLALPADLYPSSLVASVSGVSLTGGGIGTILSTYLIGTILDHASFRPVLISASIMPLIGTCCLFLLVRSRRAPSEA
jgi:ACS family hexuronate transporter-like MFS transporter